MNNNNELPLKGVRVVDFGQQIAGPAAAMALADFGATVIHIDPPGGPTWKNPANEILNRNKLSLELDLKSEEGLAQALALIDKADIVIENFRPGVMKKLGVDFESLRLARPELITLSIPGFASNDTLRREWKATEAVVAAACGGYTDMGFNRVLMGLNPSFSPLPLGSSYATALSAASAVLALYEREKTGRGDHIEVPIAAAMMEGLSYNSYVIDGLPERYKTMREHEIEYRRNNKIPLNLSYDDLQEYLDPFYRTYECADGRKFYCVCPSHRNHAKRALTVLGIYDELVAEGLPEVADLHLPISEWDGETSIGVYPLPKRWADIIAAKMKAAFLTKTSEEWGRIFGKASIPGAPHRTTEEWVQDEHVNLAGLIVEVDTPDYGIMKQPGPIAWLENEADAMLTPRACRHVSFDEALAELNEVAAEEKVTRPTGADIQPASGKGWLEDLRILDLTNVIAGPHSAAFLTRFGAEVIKLDPVKPLYDPLIGTMYTFQSGVNKRSAVVNISTEEGREIFNRLVRSVDMVVMNAPQRQILQLGLDEETLKKINPDLLFCRLDCLGGPRVGPMSEYIGYDDIIQAISGIMSRFGGIETPEEHAHIGTLDVNCGFAAGLATAVALYQKLRTGKCSRARTSLSAVTNLLQIPYCYDYAGRPPFNEPSGREGMGFGPLAHFYQTSDGWIYLDSNSLELDKIAAIEGLEGIGEVDDIKSFLTQQLAKAPSEYWTDKMWAKDIAVAVPESIKHLRSENSRLSDGTTGIDRGSFAFTIFPDHPCGHQVTQIDHYAIRPTESAIRPLKPTERTGHSTREILAEVGYDEAAIDSMLKRNIIGLGWGKEFLPS
ncbi:E-cinnamoyl-CoA:R-phenyllactate CoA transferase [Marinomonas spartinae]|uniref:E-cinnamoyl-CoA:R-phenyllactate CoA transferase n=1 Tax=Marinomonas spartinae TaxID=1792290 RepID=A0A1A8TBP1_9GAMM|nr:CoA transferase [Marinomonas spartinae]SBS27093.1 E-cinnamoyl-CoA:R-phenyllactate CoA transferase [Marinomonas spartinae]SBS29227.1 E-cinnamoyl-CoA:R-phenyllactate CoA transferase [Marinomonas spartinae]